MQSVLIDEDLLAEAIKLTGLSPNQVLEGGLKLLIQTVQSGLWQQQAAMDHQLIQAMLEFNHKQWIECSPANLDKLL